MEVVEVQLVPESIQIMLAEKTHGKAVGWQASYIHIVR